MYNVLLVPKSPWNEALQSESPSILMSVNNTLKSVNRRLLLSKLNKDEYGECSVVNKQYIRSVNGNNEKYAGNSVLLKEMYF